MPVGEAFYNPYRLLRQPGDAPARRYNTDRSSLTGFGGWLECVVVAHTPLEVNYRPNHVFNTDPRIPGSSLKGIVRSVAEFVGGGCVSVRHEPSPEGDWSLCRDRGRACVTCDMFGRLVQGRSSPLHKGKVSLGDAAPLAFERHPPLRMLQGTPKETHTAFYDRGQGAWRKFYHHHVKAAAELRIDDAPIGRFQPSTLHPVKRGARFGFRVDFEQLDARQLALLLYSLQLQPGLLHKLGRGKGRGLGSVKIEVKIGRIEDAAARLRGRASADVPAEVSAALSRLAADPSLDEFRWMHSWEAAKSLKAVRYPTYGWFKTPGNSVKRLRDVGTVFHGAELGSVDPVVDAPVVVARAAPVIASGSERWGPLTVTLDPGKGELKATFNGKTAFARGDVAKRVRASLPTEQAERLAKKKELKGVFVRISFNGNQVDLVGIEFNG